MQGQLYEYLINNLTQILVVSDDKEALKAREVCEFLSFKTYVLPDFRASFGDDLRSFSEEFFSLLANLNAYYQEKKSKKILIMPIRTALQNLPKAELLSSFDIHFADKLNLKNLKEKFLYQSYEFVDVIQEQGEISFRGDIIDIYPPNLNMPVRISLFDDEVESIRYFELESQKSFKEELECVCIYPALFSLDEKAHEDLNDKVSQLQSDAFVKDLRSLGFWCLDKNSTCNFLENSSIQATNQCHEELKQIQKERDFTPPELPLLPQATQFKDIIVGNINEFLSLNQHKKITIISNNQSNLKAYGIEDLSSFNFVKSPLVINIASNKEAIVSLNAFAKTKKRRKKASIILDELNINDYVVHENYGIGIFKGLVTAEVLGAKRDFVSIAYQGEDKLLLPVENLDLIDRYISSGGDLAVLDKLGKGSFAKLKQKAKEKLFQIAKQIVDMAASRELIEGKKISRHEKELNDFVLSSGFIYTQDQQKAIEDIFSDLSSNRIMDRLLSADVGFGKTEVAMNAILAVVKSSFQCALITPTTLLASQHFKTLHARLSPFGIKVAKLDRFVSTKEKRMVLEGLEKGEIDVIVGTHALLGVNIPNLALLVIDEEHKFGVKQKEQLKELKENVHILSMSATPIPRSLNMALSSIKGYSQILTPPNHKEDVRTFVKEYDENLIKEVILRELRRSGQIFYIHNAIASIENKAKDLKQILPKLRILVLHSKVNAKQIEEEMINFEEGKYDVLLCTSIVESGIHLPNVNTIIIEEADHFGMADLHQLRGRVGRGIARGYCYFLVNEKENISLQAKKRLMALEANSFLGSGSVLAFHDLEIRGGGNLIGEAQSGHIKNIGYSLYLRMLEDAINTLLNKQSVQSLQVELRLSVNAYLSYELINEDRIRLELYRRLSKCVNVSQIYEIEGEIEDRFGKLDTPTSQFLTLMLIKILAIEKNIHAISNYGQNITLTSKTQNKETIQAKSRDDDDILEAILLKLRDTKKEIK